MASADDQKNVILMSWDGYQRNHLLEDLSNGLLPNLETLIDQGVYLNLTVIDHKTQTKPSHAQMLTGYRGDVHGVFANAVNFTSVPEGFTVLERVEEHYGYNNIATCLIAGKYYNIYPVFKNVENVDLVSMEQVDPAVNGPKMVDFIESNTESHFFAFFHFSEPDEKGHEFGENSPQYSEGGHECDYWLGEIITILNKTGILDDTLIYVTTDHGFTEDENQHKHDPDIWLVSNDVRLRVNEYHGDLDMIDIAPTLFYSLEMNYTSYDPPLNGYPLQEKHPQSSPEHNKIHEKALAIEINIQPVVGEDDQVKIKTWYETSTKQDTCDLWEVSGSETQKNKIENYASNTKYWDIEDPVELYFFDDRENMAKITLYPPQVTEKLEYQTFYPLFFMLGGIGIGYLLTKPRNEKQREYG
jgi:hypothetical protein